VAFTTVSSCNDTCLLFDYPSYDDGLRPFNDDLFYLFMPLSE
jgi:hypothetical protein